MVRPVAVGGVALQVGGVRMTGTASFPQPLPGVSNNNSSSSLIIIVSRGSIFISRKTIHSFGALREQPAVYPVQRLQIMLQ